MRWLSGRKRRFAKPNRVPSGSDETGQNSRFPVKNPSIAILSCVSRCVVSRHDHCTICCTGRRNGSTVNRRSEALGRNSYGPVRFLLGSPAFALVLGEGWRAVSVQSFGSAGHLRTIPPSPTRIAASSNGCGCAWVPVGCPRLSRRLHGRTEDETFFITCDRSTMTFESYSTHAMRRCLSRCVPINLGFAVEKPDPNASPARLSFISRAFISGSAGEVGHNRHFRAVTLRQQPSPRVHRP